MNDEPVLRVSERIRQRLGEFSPAERRVARVLLSGPPTAGLESSARLAQQAGVSGPTISRFVINQLGFDNYAAFQQALREEISARVLTPVEIYRQYRVDRPSTDLLANCGARLAEAVTASVRAIDPGEFRRVVALLADPAHPVLATGGWFSQLGADYLVNVLREVRSKVRLVQATAADRAGTLADIARKDVVCVFDFRRYERDTQEFAQAAHDSGARIVLFTDPWLSPVADVADAVLTAEVRGPSPFESLTPTMAVVETVLTAVADELGEAARVRFERFGQITDNWIRPWPPADGAPASKSAQHP